MNSKINVISRKDIDSLYEKHVLHSLSIAATFEFEKKMKSLILAPAGDFRVYHCDFFSDVHFHLVDSIGKKIKVVEAIAFFYWLIQSDKQHIRAEEIKKRQC